MEIINYLTNAAPGFGPLAASFFGLQIGALLAGIYLAFVRRDPHPLRGPTLQRLGYVVLALGAVGTLMGALRIAGVFPFTSRYWLYIVAALEVAFAVFAFVYRRTTYRQQAIEMARSKSTRRPAPAARPTARPTASAGNGENGHSVAVGAQRASSAPGARRETRRERKRRSKR